MKDTSPKAFESFNARFLTAEEVAHTFVPPAQYFQLLESSHSILLGPRGSGKTTLLKMLQLRSLAAWKGKNAEEASSRISYHSIFLATDVLWGTQLETRTEAIEEREIKLQVRRTSFRLHLALAYLDALGECNDRQVRSHETLKRFSVEIDRDMEGVLAEALASIWGVHLESRSFFGLRFGLRSQLSQLLSFTEALRLGMDRGLPEFSLIDPINSIISAIDLTNDIFGQPDRRWAILCDELEIAPKMIRRELFQFLRSTSQKVFFKLSLYPYSSEIADIVGPDTPTSGNDYDPLNLSYAHREGAYSFCESLFKGMVSRLGGDPDTSPQHVLGEGWFDGGRRHRKGKVSPYAPPQGEFYRRAVTLSKNDMSFSMFLMKNDFDLKKIDQLSEPVQARYRKALPYILTRSEFLRHDGERRSRKASKLYTGAYSLFSLSEGNPRIFINLMKPLILSFIEKNGTVATEMQSSSAELTIHRFKSSLAAIPSKPYEEIESVLELIEIIGSFFQNSTLDQPFSSEPSVSFIVDIDTPSSLLELVGRAVNSGAFVLMPGSDKAGISDLLGARLRVAYTLAPEYKLPLVAGRAILLSTILEKFREKRRVNPDYGRQAILPFEV